MIRNTFVCLVVVFIAARPAAADTCIDQLKTYASAHVDAHSMVDYWDGAQLIPIAGSALESGPYIVYFQTAHAPNAAQVNVPNGTPMASHAVTAAPAACTNLKSINFTRNTTGQTNNTLLPPKTLAEVVTRYTSYQPDVGVAYTANSATSIAAEAVRILGQIVVDRATQQAYMLTTAKVEGWLKCTDSGTTFPATCKVLQDLRLQDLAMAPDLLRQALVSDLLTYIAKHTPDLSAINNAQIFQTLITLRVLVTSQVVPTLAEPASVQSAHASSTIVNRWIFQGLRSISTNADTAICALSTKDRIVALAGAAIASCKVSSSSSTCDVMATVAQINQSCSAFPSDDDLTYAQSIAGYEWDALTLTQSMTGGPADTTKRLVAALTGGFEIACMYAVTNTDAPFACALDPTKHGDLTVPEWVAAARDISLAAVNRDGAALVNVALQTLARLLPPADQSTTSKALRLLATVTAYAETYTSGDPNGAAAHQARTQLLESLTSDMTNRANRGGDTIFSFGGSLRAVGGFRISHSYTASNGSLRRDYAAMPALSLPLALSLDCLSSSSENALHLELGVLDVGQYVSFNDSGAVTTPDLVSAISPSFTIAWLHGTQAPLLLGLTVGYTPNFDFETGQSNAKKGAFNLGFTIGINVPLFDFN